MVRAMQPKAAQGHSSLRPVDAVLAGSNAKVSSHGEKGFVNEHR